MDTLADLVDRLDQRGQRAAVVAYTGEGEVRQTCREVADAATRLAHGLHAVGIDRDIPVAVWAPNRPEWIVAALGVLQSGAPLVPIDADADDGTLRHILEDSGAGLLVTSRDDIERVVGLELDDPPRLVVLERDDEERGADAHADDAGTADALTWSELLGSGDRDGELPDMGVDDRAVLFYTSGTTGAPKGVPLTHRNLVVGLEALPTDALVQEDDRLLVPLPFHHVYPFTVGLLLPLAGGVPVVLPRSLTPDDLQTALHEGRATLLLAVPRLLDALVKAIRTRVADVTGPASPVAIGLFQAVVEATRFSRRSLLAPVLRPVRDQVAPHLRLVASGGAKLDVDTAWALKALGWDVAVGYGLTETAPVVAFDADTQHPETVGRPVAGLEVKIDPAVEEARDWARDWARDSAEQPRGAGDGRERSNDGGLTEAPGVEGEIVVRGESVFGGYHDLPEEDDEAFADDGWFRTGDLGRFSDEGRLEVTGRRSTRIVTAAGETIDPTRLESAYAEEDAIEEIGILEREGRPVAVVVPARQVRAAGGDDADHAGHADHAVREAIGRASRRLPEHSRVADHVVTTRPLERTRIGKIRRKELEQRFQAAKEGRVEQAEPVHVDEMEPAERRLLEDQNARAAWDLLVERFPETDLGPDTEPRYDLGVDSIDWLDIMQSVASETGVRLDRDRIGDVQTVRDLLQAVAVAEPEMEPGEFEDRIQVALENPDDVLDEKDRDWLADLPRPVEGVARGLHALDGAVLKRLYGIEYEGLDRLPAKGPMILAPNHVSLLDPFVLDAGLPDAVRMRLYWLGWEGIVTHNPINRAVGRLSHTLPAGPARPEVALAYATKVIESNGVLGWFPEGSRSTDGRLQRLRPGIAHVLLHHDVPVVPVAIVGTREIWPAGRATPRVSGRVRVTFDEPVRRDALLAEGKGDDDMARVLDALRRRLGRRLEATTPAR